MPQVRLTSLTKVFPPGGGVRDVSLTIAAAEHLVVVGPSGAGKTTLLRLIAGLETADRGAIHFDDCDVTHRQPHERHVAFVGQRPALYSQWNVAKNLAAGVNLRQSSGRLWRRLRGIPDPISAVELTRKVHEVADWLGLSAMLDRPIQSLSGGEQQRVALGRAVVAGHPLWLMDEPLAHLDPLTRDAVRGQLLLLRSLVRPTIIEVTHDPADALLIGHRVAVLEMGRLVQVGTPAEVYARPTSRAAATSLGWPPMNFIDGPAAPDAGATGLPCAAVLGVRAEDVALGPCPPGAVDLGEWSLVSVQPAGPRDLWTLQSERGVSIPRVVRRWANPGDKPAALVQLHVLNDRAHWFMASGGCQPPEKSSGGCEPPE